MLNFYSWYNTFLLDKTILEFAENWFHFKPNLKRLGNSMAKEGMLTNLFTEEHTMY